MLAERFVRDFLFSEKLLRNNLGFMAGAAIAGFALAAPTTAIAAAPSGLVLVGNTRFTVITAECIRIESAGSDGAFVDLPSMFAANRGARYTQYRLEQTSQRTIIDTGVIRLTYTPDGKPLGATNLSAAIHRGAISATWTPGAANPGNLGGTIRTLDGADGAEDLGQGVVSRDGWYLLDDSRSNLLTKDWVESRPANAGNDWYLFGYGDDYKGALKSLTTIGGPVPLPRKYLLGSWYSRFWPYTSADYRGIIAEYASHDFPIDNIVMDMDWHLDGWTGWSWNRTLLPDAEALLQDFHKQGLHVTLNVHPADGVGPKETAYAKFMQDMGKDPATRETLPFDAGSKKYLDTLFADTHDPLTKAGVDFWWLDWQQYEFTRSIPDLTNLAWLNHYYFNYTAKNGQRGVSFSRWAGWGDHRYPIHFSGDASTSWRMLTFEVPMTATAGNVGCFFWSHDIGGHNRGRNEESYTRWCQFGALSAALRSHSTRDKSMDRRPWTYPDWAEASMRQSFHLRSELFPYIYTSAAESVWETVPLTRPLYIDYPNDEHAYHNGQEYLFGDNLLVAPITMPGVGPGRVGRQVVYFPAGTWFNVFSGERFVGPTERLVSADINEMPLYVRAGAPLPMQPYSPRMATAPLTTLRVRCFPGPDGQTIDSSLYEDDGVTDAYTKGRFATTPLSYLRKGADVTIRIGAAAGKFEGQPAKRSYAIELPDTRRPAAVTVNGKSAPFTFDEKTGTTQIAVADRSIVDAVTVVAHIPGGDIDYDVLTAAVAQRRLAEVLVQMPDIFGGVTPPRLALLAAGAADAKTREAVLAVFGIGVVDKSEAPYLYRGTRALSFYAPPGFLDADRFQKISADTTAPLPPASPLLAGQNVLSSSETPDDPNRAVGVTFTLQSKSFTVPDLSEFKNNVARLATVTVSSVEPGYGQTGLTDGVLDGYPGDTAAEWSSKQLVGASCTLTWSTPQTVDRIGLYDRPNTTDQITSGTLVFSDGTTIAVGALPNDGQTPAEITFPAKTITSVRFEVTGVRKGTEHAGLSEFQVFRAAGG